MFSHFLDHVISSPPLHAKWLNTLAYLENCGARLIARSEHPTMVEKEILKHAAEEFRHAYFLKSLALKTDPTCPLNFEMKHLMGNHLAYHYMSKLNLQISRYLKNHVFLYKHLKESAYLLVTYAIEKRALKIYPLYEKSLRKNQQTFSIQSLIREEKGHLSEISRDIENNPLFKQATLPSVHIEKALFTQWVKHLMTPFEL